MTDKDFALIVERTKRVVLSAIEKNLYERFYFSIDDVVQETYIRAYKNLIKESFRGDSSLETWLYKIAMNESLRMNERLLREEKKSKKLMESMEDEVPAERDELVELNESIASLPEKYSSVLSLLGMGYSLKEISIKLGLNIGTVKSRISRAKDLLRNKGEGL
ncbi:MAG TPA: sigma-70 family RNA polymerase sigma factor [Spirochaetota bacterium]|jgi:RNA polymerase sigma factor (sigma-70 family)|nr:sigma-70 family RNA polymerase sigma factor [Spirochaetota bacterium]OQA95753.1 MAG: ECF RNA polymerase sigma-E factor [Spirochaetes bacterium ADurb.Bin218]HON16317.1 sigma-70 family RNA polymerase sigma factor [Spirochaetota bacterium]HOQ11448.1 sigma-70 family RNA polymerase sigma factor [Spirochaetota bacterium]HOV09878.1 sigma-70 family RNA polymerase sigma factor [Spirochaetota bacterium]